MMKPEPIDDETLVAILQREEDGAVGFHDGELAEAQQVAINFYNGELFGDEEDGRSQFVTRDVAEVVDHMTVSVLRPFVSGDHVVEFEGHDKAKEATASVNLHFSRKQNGYRVLHDWLKGGLLEKIGVVKTCVETETKVQRETREVPVDVLTALKAEGASIVASEPIGDPLVDEETGEEYSSAYRITVEHKAEYKCFRDYVLPVEEVRFAPRTVDEDSTGYFAHVSRKTRSALVEMGFDPEVVYSLPHECGPDASDTAYDRFEDQDGGWSIRGVDSDPSMQECLLREEYIRLDRDGDGIAELLCVHRVESTILKVAELDEHGCVVFTPFPMPGRMVGHSLADKTMDIQRLRSVVTRQTLDGFYFSNNPRIWLHEDSIGENTVDDLLTVRPGGLNRWKGVAKPEIITPHFDIGAGMTMLEFATGERESRTGITRMNQGLDRDALNKTASGTAMMMQAGQEMEDYIARNFGECLARLFAKKYRLMREYGEPFTVNIDGEPIEVDPRTWPESMDMNVQVGLGTGKKDQRIALRQMIIGLQAEAVAAGRPIVDDKRLYNSAAGIIRDANLGSPNEYFIDPESPEAQQAAAQKGEQPDPETLKVQAEMQAKQAELQMKQQAQQMDMQLRQQEGELKLQLAREEAAAKAQLEQAKAEREYELALRKMDAEMALAQQKLAMEREIARERAQYDAAAKTEAAKLSSNRPGGKLDE